MSATTGSAWESEIDISQDQALQQNWGNLFALLSQSPDEKNNTKGLIDQLVLEVTYGWLEENDSCGVYQDVLDIALQNLAGNTLNQIREADITPFLPPNLNAREALPEGTQDLSVSLPVPPPTKAPTKAPTNMPTNRPTKTPTNPTTASPTNLLAETDFSFLTDAPSSNSTFEGSMSNDRRLEFFTEQSCSTFESTVFLGNMLSFSSCSNLDIGKLFGSIEERVVNVALGCLNTFLQPFQSQETCASRNFQNYVMDECVKGVASDDILGHVFQLFLVNPKQTCSCLSSLTAVPTCRVDVTKQLTIDGMLTSKVACLLETQVCSKLEVECDGRLAVLDECLPDLKTIKRGDFDCEEVQCNCERADRGLLNYAGKAMQLPMTDMCTETANSRFSSEIIPERYASFQNHCGAQYLFDAVPTNAPTLVPSASPTSNSDALASLIRGRENISSVNSVMSGILLALAITGVASIFLVIILVLWRRRFRSTGRRVATIEDLKASKEKQIRRLQEEVRRMEEAAQKEISASENSGSENSESSDSLADLEGA